MLVQNLFPPLIGCLYLVRFTGIKTLMWLEHIDQAEFNTAAGLIPPPEQARELAPC